MNKLIAALCCLLLAASPLALAQDKSTGKKAAPVSAKEKAEKEKAVKSQLIQCSNQARDRKLDMGGEEFNRFMSRCLKG